MVLKGQQTILDRVQCVKVVWCKDLSLNDREVNFDLIQPTGMDRGVNQNEMRPAGAQSFNGSLSAVRRTIIDNAKDAAGRTIRLISHDLCDEAIERGAAIGQFTSAKDLSLM